MAYRSLPVPCEPILLGEFLSGDYRHPAVYLLYFRGEVVYVGQSRTLKLRIDEHLVQGLKTFDAVAFVRCPFNRLNEVESHFIRELAPRYNNCATARKVRQRASWSTQRNRRELNRAMFADPQTLDPDNLTFMDAKDCVLRPSEVGEFLGVTDKAASDWLDTGELSDTSLMGLLMFAAGNRHEVRKAQTYFENL